MAEFHRGGCVCGSIRYRVQGEPVRAYVCHCTFCQRFTGGAFSVITWFNEENVEITGDGIATYDHTVDALIGGFGFISVAAAEQPSWPRGAPTGYPA